ncbi:hypothetical protein EDB87DRAFT_1638372 [Lactarius vividus]|nr:hypothetical protein EDB87DRAFT_1638372 [Lactarius vividus]
MHLGRGFVVLITRPQKSSVRTPPSQPIISHSGYMRRIKDATAQIAHPLLRKRRLSQYPPVLLAMLDLTNLSSALEGPQDGGSTSMSTNSSYLRPPSASIHHCTTCCTLFSRSESSRNQSFLKSPRPLPIPPLFVPPLPILLTSSSPMPSSSTSSVTSTTSHLLPCHSRTIARPLPKMPKSTPSPLGTTRRGTSTEERSLPPTPTSPADLPESSSAPQQSAIWFLPNLMQANFLTARAVTRNNILTPH